MMMMKLGAVLMTQMMAENPRKEALIPHLPPPQPLHLLSRSQLNRRI
jgi:hypothetical protein